MGKYASNFLKNVSVRNFKSVRSLTIADCRRINVLIGRPNVGKSNILEALAMFDVPYIVSSSNRSLRQLIRIDSVADLFHNGMSSSPTEVDAEGRLLTVARNNVGGLNLNISIQGVEMRYSFTPSLSLSTRKDPSVLPDINAYFFPHQIVPESAGVSYLLPPSGGNLMEVVASLPDLKERLSGLFHGYGLKMMFDSGSRQIKAMRENGLDMFLIPFNSLADSLQRLIFYKAAIESNHNKILCFEEPEAHTFPPYIANVVNDIIASDTNQYFITTHSPYVMNTLLESTSDDLAVYVVDMQDGATTARRLNDEQLQAAYDNGMDMFFNLEAFLD